MRYIGAQNITTLIFDLGNVIVDLDGSRVIHSLAQHTDVSVEQIKELIVGNSDLFAYETGQISSDEFVLSVCETLKMNLTYADFEKIWNSMLVAIPGSKLELLKSCRINYQTMIMSNTNEMHEIAFDGMVSEVTNGMKMSELVDVAYYSHKMNLRKPDVRVFTQIIEAHNLTPEEVVFFDDKEENTAAASQAGIQSILISHPQDLFKYFG